MHVSLHVLLSLSSSRSFLFVIFDMFPFFITGAPSDDAAGHGSADAGRDNASPVATDDDDDDAEEDTTGDEETGPQSQPQPQTGDRLLSCATEKCQAQDLLQLCEVERAAESEKVTSESPRPSLNISAPVPLTSLSNMTVPATFGDAKTKDDVIGAVGKTSSAKPATAVSGSAWHPDHTGSEGTCTTPDQVSSSPTRMASVIVPMASIARKIAASPEEKAVDRATLISHTHSHQSHHRSLYEKMIAIAPASATVTGTIEDQPLDLSKKSSRPRSVSDPDPPTASRVGGGSSLLGLEREGAALVNGKSSLESLQRRFGGDFALEQMRRPSSIIPLQSTVLSTSAALRPLAPPTNGFSSLGSSSLVSAGYHHHHHQHNHHGHHSSSHHQGSSSTKARSSTKGDHLDKLLSAACSKSSSQPSLSAPSSSSASSAAARKPLTSSGSAEPVKKTESSACPKTKSCSSSSNVSAVSGASSNSTSGGINGGDSESKYTIHRCSCQKTFGTLYALSAHLQETGHVPGSSKQASLMDYPKLVRGQDMWLNQVIQLQK